MAIKNEDNRVAAEKLWQRYEEAINGPFSMPRMAFIQVIGEALDDLEAQMAQLKWELLTRTQGERWQEPKAGLSDWLIRGILLWCSRAREEGFSKKAADWEMTAESLEEWIHQRMERGKLCGAVDPDGDFTCKKKPHPVGEPHSAPLQRNWPWGHRSPEQWGTVAGELTWYDLDQGEDEAGVQDATRTVAQPEPEVVRADPDWLAKCIRWWAKTAEEEGETDYPIAWWWQTAESLERFIEHRRAKGQEVQGG